MKSIAYFTFNLTHYSGAAQQAWSLARHLSDYRILFFNVEVGNRKVRVEENQGGQAYIVIHLPTNYLSATWAVLHFCRKYNIRLFHLHGLVGVGLLTGYLLKVPIVLKSTLLGSDDFDSIATKRFGSMIVHVLCHIDKNIAVSRCIEQINRKYIPDHKIENIPNGVELDMQQKEREDPVFCCVGLVCERKQTHKAIKYFISHYASLPRAMLYVVGPYNDDGLLREGNSEYLNYCRSLIPPALVHTVKFTGQLSKQRVLALYRRCIGFIFFSKYEGMPNALLEAMAANCVPIVDELGGVAREVIPNSDCGFIVDPLGPAPLISQLRDVALQRGIIEHVQQQYDFEKLSERYREIYNFLIR